jgi:hypothetical protein
MIEFPGGTGAEGLELGPGQPARWTKDAASVDGAADGP